MRSGLRNRRNGCLVAWCTSDSVRSIKRRQVNVIDQKVDAIGGSRTSDTAIIFSMSRSARTHAFFWQRVWHRSSIEAWLEHHSRHDRLLWNVLNLQNCRKKEVLRTCWSTHRKNDCPSAARHPPSFRFVFTSSSFLADLSIYRPGLFVSTNKGWSLWVFGRLIRPESLNRSSIAHSDQ